jgi:PrcB C-terminal
MKISKLSLSSTLVAALALCSANVIPLNGDGSKPAHPRPVSSVIHLPLATVNIPLDDLGNVGDTQSLFLITTLAEYQQLFGEDARGVDFQTEWAFFYSAGLEPHGGYEALVQDVAYTPDVQSLVITTQLLSPGAGCEVAQIVTKPYMLVKFPKPPGAVGVVRYDSDDQVVDCPQDN